MNRPATSVVRHAPFLDEVAAALVPTRGLLERRPGANMEA
jgi:hypothetical protein